MISSVINRIYREFSQDALGFQNMQSRVTGRTDAIQAPVAFAAAPGTEADIIRIGTILTKIQFKGGGQLFEISNSLRITRFRTRGIEAHQNHTGQQTDQWDYN